VIILCAVCFQGADAVMRDSLNGGIFVLLGVTGVVLASVAAFFVRLARLARHARAAGGADDEALFGEVFPPGVPGGSGGR
jgi:hypothetical protein